MLTYKVKNIPPKIIDIFSLYFSIYFCFEKKKDFCEWKMEKKMVMWRSWRDKDKDKENMILRSIKEKKILKIFIFVYLK